MTDKSWVNAVIEIVVPLDDVEVGDSTWEKQLAAANATERIMDALPESMRNECCFAGKYVDMHVPANTPYPQPTKEFWSRTGEYKCVCLTPTHKKGRRLISPQCSYCVRIKDKENDYS